MISRLRVSLVSRGCALEQRGASIQNRVEYRPNNRYRLPEDPQSDTRPTKNLLLPGRSLINYFRSNPVTDATFSRHR